MQLGRITLKGRSNPLHFDSDIHSIEMVKIWKQFADVIANQGVDLELKSGEVHALLGENGAGKTTLMKILSGYYRPDSGKILINGEQVEFPTPAAAMRAGVGIVHQHFHLIETMTAA